jgi:hypothetical protein
MTAANLYHELSLIDHSIASRNRMSNLILNNPVLHHELLKIAFSIDDSISCKACWVIEFSSSKEIDWIFPYLDSFIPQLSKVYRDTAIRPLSKVCMLLLQHHFTKNNTLNILNETHLKDLVALTFDWLITNQKVAAKAHAMHSLYLLGTKYDWIHADLKMVLEKDYHAHTAAYKAKARHTLVRIKAFRNKKKVLSKRQD